MTSMGVHLVRYFSPGRSLDGMRHEMPGHDNISGSLSQMANVCFFAGSSNIYSKGERFIKIERLGRKGDPIKFEVISREGGLNTYKLSFPRGGSFAYSIPYTTIMDEINNAVDGIIDQKSYDALAFKNLDSSAQSQANLEERLNWIIAFNELEKAGLKKSQLRPDRLKPFDITIKYAKSLLEMNAADIFVDNGVMEALTKARGENEKFINELIKEHSNGKKIDGEFIMRMPLNSDYSERIIILDEEHKKLIAEIARNNIPVKPSHLNNKYALKAILRLLEAGVKMTQTFIFTLAVKNLVHDEYVDKIIKDHKSKKCIGVKYLRPSRPPSDKGRKNRIYLKKDGDESFVLPAPLDEEAKKLVEELESRNIPLYPWHKRTKECLKRIIAMSDAGMKMDGNIMIGLSSDKLDNEKYIKTLIIAHKIGIEIDAQILNAFTVSKLTNNIYFGSIFKLIGMESEVGDKERSTWKKYVKALIISDTELSRKIKEIMLYNEKRQKLG